MGVIDKLRDTFGYEPVDSNKRTANNKKVIDALFIEDDMNKFIREEFAENHETNRLVHVMFRQIRQRNREILTKTELFLDNWGFQHGGITKANYKEAIRAWFKYAMRILEARNRKQEDAEFRAIQGSLDAGFDDGPFKGLPDDGAFEKAILKQRPELKRK